MNDVEVLNRFAQLEVDAEAKGLTLTFSGEEFLLRKLDSQLWAKCDRLREVAAAIVAYARMCEVGTGGSVCPECPSGARSPSVPSPTSLKLAKARKS
ncbi:MAG TPA: hypothetical protein VN649_21115 [Ramlibacter sp.]|nr:hypothetical protein [Ramlibacter sp.]